MEFSWFLGCFGGLGLGLVFGSLFVFMVFAQGCFVCHTQGVLAALWSASGSGGFLGGCLGFFLVFGCSNFCLVWFCGVPLTFNYECVFLVAAVVWGVVSAVGKGSHSFLLFKVLGGVSLVLSLLLFFLEVLSGLLRVLTLSFRLVCNLITGHILLVLCFAGGSFLGVFSGGLYLLLEGGILVLQAWIFTMLLSTYASEGGF